MCMWHAQMADYIISCNVHSCSLQVTLGHRSMDSAALMMTIAFHCLTGTISGGGLLLIAAAQ